MYLVVTNLPFTVNISCHYINLVAVKILPSQMDITLQFDCYIYYIFVILTLPFQVDIILWNSFMSAIFNIYLCYSDYQYPLPRQISYCLILSALFGCH